MTKPNNIITSTRMGHSIHAPKKTSRTLQVVSNHSTASYLNWTLARRLVKRRSRRQVIIVVIVRRVITSLIGSVGGMRIGRGGYRTPASGGAFGPTFSGAGSYFGPLLLPARSPSPFLFFYSVLGSAKAHAVMYPTLQGTLATFK
jgi:hypothetical protein